MDLNEDLFLRDHTLGREIATLDGSLLALPIVPFTVSMEILAEAAHYLVVDDANGGDPLDASASRSQQVLVGMRNVRAHRWILLERGSIHLQVIAKRTQQGQEQAVSVELWEGDHETDQTKVIPIVEGTMLFAPVHPSPPDVEPLLLHNERPSRWSGDTVYREGMFHGPTFQVIAEMERSGDNGSATVMQAKSPVGFLRSWQVPAFLAEPVILDAAGQQIGLWTLENLEESFVVFPYHLRELSFFGPSFRPGDRIQCQARTELLEGNRVTSDIDLVDELGSVRIRLNGWEDKRFHISREMYAFIISPGRNRLSKSWNLPSATGIEGEPYQCRWMGDWVQWEANYDFWEKVLAYASLTRTEHEAWRRLTYPNARRREWLLGRIAAKEAVVSLIRHCYNLDLAPADVEIQSAENGCPTVHGGWLAQVEHSISISIAHCDGKIIALAGLEKPNALLGVGIDIESADRPPESFVDIAFTEPELEVLSALEGVEHGSPLGAFTHKTGDGAVRPFHDPSGCWPLRVWCAKEAVGKALGCGLIDGPHGIVANQIYKETGTVMMRISKKMAERYPRLEGRPIEVLTVVENGLVVATVLDDNSLQRNE